MYCTHYSELGACRCSLLVAAAAAPRYCSALGCHTHATATPGAPQAPFSFRAASIVVRNTVSTNEFKNGMTVEIDGVPFKVIGAWPSGGRTRGSDCDRRDPGRARLEACFYTRSR